MEASPGWIWKVRHALERRAEGATSHRAHLAQAGLILPRYRLLIVLAQVRLQPFARRRRLRYSMPLRPAQPGKYAEIMPASTHHTCRNFYVSGAAALHGRQKVATLTAPFRRRSDISHA